jgi:lysine-N-methylase
MIRRVPHYYKYFKCIASQCKDNCCVGGWEIDLDEETAQYYLNLPGEFGDMLRNSITKTDEYCFKLKDGKCPFLDCNHLCEIYQTLGEDKMGVVCTQFPRYTEYYGEIKETGIGLACEEVARIIFSDDEAFSLACDECDEEIVDDAEFDKLLADNLFVLRDVIFSLLENKNADVYDKLSLLVCIGWDVQQLINQNHYDELEKLCTKLSIQGFDYIKESSAKFTRIQKSKHIKDDILKFLYAYDQLETLGNDWPDALEQLYTILHSDDMRDEQYDGLCKEFMDSLGKRKKEYEILLKYFIFRYFMKAAYDHDVFGKMQLTVTNFFVIRELDLMKWFENKKKFSFEDRMDTVHIFSREVEYSEDNLFCLAEEFIFDDIFKAPNLLGLIKACKESEK